MSKLTQDEVHAILSADDLMINMWEDVGKEIPPNSNAVGEIGLRFTITIGPLHHRVNKR